MQVATGSLTSVVCHGYRLLKISTWSRTFLANLQLQSQFLWGLSDICVSPRTNSESSTFQRFKISSRFILTGTTLQRLGASTVLVICIPFLCVNRPTLQT